MIVGLGNPGKKYARTRHNVGSSSSTRSPKRWALHDWQKKNDARFRTRPDASGAAGRAAVVHESERRAGYSVSATFYKIPPVAHSGRRRRARSPVRYARMRAQGSSGGHNGLNSLIDALGPNFAPAADWHRARPRRRCDRPRAEPVRAGRVGSAAGAGRARGRGHRTLVDPGGRRRDEPR